MPVHLHLSLGRFVQRIDDGADVLVAECDGRAVRLPAAGPSMRSLLDHLAEGGRTLDALLAPAPGQADDPTGRICADAVAALSRRALLRTTLAAADGRPLATLEPLAAAFAMAEVDAAAGGRFRLSRFAWLRRLEGRLLLESPLGFARVVVDDARLAGLIGLLAEPCRAADLAGLVPGLDAEAAAVLLGLLVNAGAVFACDAEGALPEDADSALRQWEFHDLLFHSRSRAGRHLDPVGMTNRFLGDIAPEPAVRPAMAEHPIPLPVPDMARLAETDPPFSRVAEARRTVRGRGEAPLSGEQLAEFLFRTIRIKSLLPAHPEQHLHYEASLRPCCSGGALHPIEFYLTVDRVAGLEPGFYHYDARRHALEPLGGPSAATTSLLAHASAAAGMATAPDVLITLAARFPRVAWKYQTLAYALVLKDAGALFQQMYLVATAQGLAPCAIGSGDSDLFARASGLPYAGETAVGEFILSSRP